MILLLEIILFFLSFFSPLLNILLIYSFCIYVCVYIYSSFGDYFRVCLDVVYFFKN